MWPFNLLTEDAQVALLAAACALLGALAGYTFKWWLDRRESDRQWELELEEADRIWQQYLEKDERQRQLDKDEYDRQRQLEIDEYERRKEENLKDKRLEDSLVRTASLEQIEQIVQINLAEVSNSRNLRVYRKHSFLRSCATFIVFLLLSFTIIAILTNLLVK